MEITLHFCIVSGFSKSSAGDDGVESSIFTLWPQLTQITNPRMHLFHTSQFSIQNRHVHIFVTGCTKFVNLTTLGAVNGVNFVQMTASKFQCYIAGASWGICRALYVLWKFMLGWHIWYILWYVKRVSFDYSDFRIQTTPLTVNPNMSN